MAITSTANTVELLDSVRIRSSSLEEARKRYALQLAPDFQLINHLRHDELALSRYLGLLLDTRGSHAQKDLFLRDFTRRLGRYSTWVNTQELLSVRLEQQANDQRRLDILLSFSNGLVGIEHKPWAGDQKDQLNDYADFLRSAAAGRNWLLIYICNDDPSEESIRPDKVKQLSESGNYVRLDFTQVADWLEYCARFSRAPKVGLFVDELAGFVRQRINGEMEMTEAEEMKNLILQKDEYLTSAFQISGSMNRLKEELLAELEGDLRFQLKAHGMELLWDGDALRNGRTYAGFGARFQPEHKVFLCFEFGSKGLNSLEWGICRSSRDITLERDKAETINKVMTGVFGSGTLGANWPWYPGQGPQDTILNEQDRNWAFCPEPWLRIRDKSDKGFAAMVVKLAIDVRNAFKDAETALC